MAQFLILFMIQLKFLIKKEKKSITFYILKHFLRTLKAFLYRKLSALNFYLIFCLNYIATENWEKINQNIAVFGHTIIFFSLI